MGKVNNALRMLAILRSRKKVTRSELAKELEVNEREVTRYKENLEYAGVSINNTRGKFGGYELIGNDYLLNLDLSTNEVRSLENVVQDLKLSGNHFYSDIDSINNKIKVDSKIKDEAEVISFSSIFEYKEYIEGSKETHFVVTKEVSNVLESGKDKKKNLIGQSLGIIIASIYNMIEYNYSGKRNIRYDKVTLNQIAFYYEKVKAYIIH